MKTKTFPFAEISKIDNSIAEIIACDGVEIDVDNVSQLYNWKRENLNAPFGILVNKINSYSYTFEAQMKLGDLEEIKAVAVISYQKLTEISTRLLKTAPTKQKLNLEIFDDRNQALKWLKAELAEV